MTEVQTFSTKPEECESHTRNYRQGYEYPADGTTVYVFTCLMCGHQWREDGPVLDVSIEFTTRTEVKIDLIGYFNGLTAAAIDDYKFSDIERWGYSEEWERPFAFLAMLADNMGQDQHGATFAYSKMPEAGKRRIVQERTEEDDAVEVEVRVREGKRAYNRDWTYEDFETLRRGVEWLDLFHRGIEDDETTDEERLEELARIPGPNDNPLFDA